MSLKSVGTPPVGIPTVGTPTVGTPTLYSFFLSMRRPQNSSLSAKWLELAGTLGGLDGELALFLLIDEASFHELRHQAGCHLARLVLLLELLHLQFKTRNLS